MGKKILVDSDILLKAYRGDKIKHQQLQFIKKDFSISVITAFEILNGARSIKQLHSTKKELKAYPVIHLNTEISMKTLELYSNYSVRKQMKVADLLIAATAIVSDLLLYTDNKRDFEFIKGIQFYEEK